MKMLILIGCEFSQRICEAFRKKGHEAYSCDLLDGDINPAWHLKMDVRQAIQLKKWDMGIFHPPCTDLTVACSRLWPQKQADGRQGRAVEFVKALWNAPINKIAIENPVGYLSTAIRKPDQIIQPYNFGEDASKATCLWLKNLPKLVNTKYIEPRIVNGLKRWANQTDSGQNKIGPSEDRWKIRSITYQGIADAIAEQWSV